MEFHNLAAAIRRWCELQHRAEPETQFTHLTNEEAINLAEWLSRESPISVWRSIPLAAPQNDDPSSARASEGQAPNPKLK